jgi:hypothetical protein
VSSHERVYVIADPATLQNLPAVTRTPWTVVDQQEIGAKPVRLGVTGVGS